MAAAKSAGKLQLVTEKVARLGNTYEPLILPSEDKPAEIWSFKYCKISGMQGHFAKLSRTPSLRAVLLVRMRKVFEACMPQAHRFKR